MDLCLLEVIYGSTKKRLSSHFTASISDLWSFKFFWQHTELFKAMCEYGPVITISKQKRLIG
jgi:hypothetical protein